MSWREGGGAPETLLVPMGWVYGGLLVGISIVSRVILDSFQLMVPLRITLICRVVLVSGMLVFFVC